MLRKEPIKLQKYITNPVKVTLEKYLDHRKERRLTPGEVVYLLRKRGYSYEVVSTSLEDKKYAWPRGKGMGIKRDICETYEGKIPHHFAYIKFYTIGEGKELFALVAGKTSLYPTSETPDFEFKLKEGSFDDIEELGGNKAKIWLKSKEKEGFRWYSEGVLAVWSPRQLAAPKRGRAQINWALSVESDIGGLLGLFYS